MAAHRAKQAHASGMSGGLTKHAGGYHAHSAPALKLSIDIHQSRISRCRLRLSAARVQAAPDSRYTLTYASPKCAERPSATRGANAAPMSQPRSEVKAAPVERYFDSKLDATAPEDCPYDTPRREKPNRMKMSWPRRPPPNSVGAKPLNTAMSTATVARVRRQPTR